MPPNNVVPPVSPQPPQQFQPITNNTGLADAPRPRRPRRRWVFGIIGAIVAALGIGIILGFTWYNNQLKSVSSDTTKVRFVVKAGSTPDEIGKNLEDHKLIRSAQAFSIYTRVNNVRGKLQAGTYSISPSETLQDVVNDLVNGTVDQFSVTFLPGATIKEDKQVLISAGYSAAEVDAAFSKTYSHPVLSDKPAGQDLEGYIYGETYAFPLDATIEQIIQRTLDQLYTQVQANGLVEKYKARGLSLYQGITLASIVQREVAVPSDQKDVAAVFYNRLKIGMNLGSDVTFHYGADKLGVDARYDLDSPYNTRIYPGLPPGPIAAPGLSALLAVADPASSDYLFFISGDDDKMYYGRTEAEHNQNVSLHCAVKCSGVK